MRACRIIRLTLGVVSASATFTATFTATAEAQVPSGAGARPEMSPTTGPSVRAVLDVGTPAPDGTVRLTVRLAPEAIALAAYQGTLRFTPGSLRVLRTATPRGDGTRLVNAADSTRGILRFAGYTVARFTDLTVLTLDVRPVTSLDRARPQVTIEVAADSAGTRVPTARLLPSTAARPRP